MPNFHPAPCSFLPAPARLGLFLVWVLIGTAPLRAQVTESPYTIPPGHFLLRVDAITVGVNRDRTEPHTYTGLGLASALFSTGITRDLDVQLGQQFFLRQTYQINGTRNSASGRGDATVRMKWTYWRDTNGSAAAVMPFVKLPSSTAGIGNNHVEGGLIFPWEVSYGTGTKLGAMGSWDFLRTGANDGYYSRWFASAFAQQHLFGSLSGYGETTLAVSSLGFSSFVGSLGAGLLWDMSNSLQFDYKLSRGLGNQATEWTHVLRVNWHW